MLKDIRRETRLGAPLDLLAVDVLICPSSDDLRLIRQFVKGGSGSSGVRV
jgi:hypothetical protein